MIFFFLLAGSLGITNTVLFEQGFNTEYYFINSQLKRHKKYLKNNDCIQHFDFPSNILTIISWLHNNQKKNLRKCYKFKSTTYKNCFRHQHLPSNSTVKHINYLIEIPCNSLCYRIRFLPQWNRSIILCVHQCNRDQNLAHFA